MPPLSSSAPPLESLADITRILDTSEEFIPLVAALKSGLSATVDGAWGSSAGLAAAVLARQATQTVLVVIAHPHDLDGWADDLAGFSGQPVLLFPAWDHLPDDRTVIDAVASQRLQTLKALETLPRPRCVLTTIQALIQPVPGREHLRESRRVLTAPSTLPPEELAAWLIDRGYRRTDAVELPGEFSRRGGILDIFSPDAEAPFRLEFFGDDIESIRQFSLATQRSLGAYPSVEVVGLPSAQNQQAHRKAHKGHLSDYLAPGSWVVLVEPGDLQEEGKHYLERVTEPLGLFSVQGVMKQLLRFPSITVSALPSYSVEASCHLRVESVERFSGNVAQVRDELDAAAGNDRVLIACHNEAECKRLQAVLASGQLAQSERLRLVTGRIQAGFRLVDAGIVVLGSQDLFHRDETRRVQPSRRLETRALDSFLELAEGDLVVHVSHGIARYHGMQVLDKHGHAEEHLVLEFAGGVRLYVPASKIDLVQKYVGGARTEPELSKLGGLAWERRKARVQSAVLDLAAEMIELQALREARPGLTYPADSDWQAEFEASFAFEETPDQLTTLVEIKRDMQRGRPMDRLICGDVGYGKTELAVRAAFKAIDNGYQVAVLVPTTVLAEQHARTFSQRLAEYPFVVEGLSRFRTGGEQKRILQRLEQGGIDVVIGTHRLLSHDVHFKDLGLVIIDEEQRFGVEHKERLKRLRQTVDVLTMTATPIPRTLHLSLLGIRDISNLETPPPSRLAVETRICRFDPQLIRHAIMRELNREGQVFFVHNRVHDIHLVADRLGRIVPEARLQVAHGQMGGDELERAMLRFVRRECDVLVATTIIESGLDIPNANTIFIDQADRYGLADLHQLRGRVGRWKHRAYAYLLLEADQAVTTTAARRMKAIEEFTELGAGFKIALRDLEIRGAGNILGTQQSGHIAAIGYELYCQLLENAARQLKNQPLRTPLETSIDLPLPALLPRDYVPGQRLRIEVYRRLARVRHLERLEDFRQELRDRFGPLPEAAQWLLRQAELRLLATRWQVVSIHLEGPGEGSVGPTDLVLRYRSARKIKRLAERNKRLRIVDEANAYFRLTGPEEEPMRLYETLRKLLHLEERGQEAEAV